MSRQFFPCLGILEVSNSDELKTYLVEQGSHTPEENLRIYEKWFANAPRYLFRAVDRKYGLRQKILCDAGCAYGMNLVVCKPGSYGIEVEKDPVEFALSLGLRVYRRDVLRDELSDLPQAEAVWASAILEHVDSPHIFLRKLHGLLVDGGLLAVYAPTIPILPVLRYLPWCGRFFRGHLAADHVNFFTTVTLRLTCERAGFETIEVSPFYPSALGIFNRVPGLRSLVDGCVYVGHKIPDWKYPQKATRQIAKNKHGFVRKQ